MSGLTKLDKLQDLNKRLTNVEELFEGIMIDARELDVEISCGKQIGDGLSIATICLDLDIAVEEQANETNEA